jgi:hypothetical protein
MPAVQGVSLRHACKGRQRPAPAALWLRLDIVTASPVGLSTQVVLPFATGSRAAARRSVAANLFAGAALYVSPDYAKNAAKSLAKFPATSLDAKRIKAVQVRLFDILRIPALLPARPISISAFVYAL